MGERWLRLPPRLPPASPRWAAPSFAAELTDWCERTLGPLSGAREVERRPWSTLWRVRSADGAWWAKQSCPLEAFEAGLHAELARLVPDRVVPVTAADPECGLLLTPDAGPTLREAGGGADGWAAVLSGAAQLQRAVLPGLDRLVAAGLTPLTVLPAYAEDRAEALAALPPGHPQRLDPSDAERLAAARPAVRRWADEVAALGLPPTIVHNDLHDANAVATTADGRLRFLDFGDALLADPVLALTVPLGVLADRTRPDGGAAAGPDAVRRAAEPFLEVWSDVAPVRALRAALPAALRLGCLGRVESWLRVQASFTDAELAEHGSAPGAWLLRLLDAPPL